MIWIDNIDLFIASLIFAFLIGWLCDMAVRQITKKDTPFTAHISMVVAAVFLCVYGFTPAALRCILLCQVLIVAGVFDLATYEIPDCLHLLAVMTGLISFQPLPALLGVALVPLPFLITALKTEKIGGGDVKLMAASGFVLGVTGGVWMMIGGLFMGLLWNAAFRREKNSLPLAPFLAFGAFMAMFPA